jgi:hypothetical protein
VSETAAGGTAVKGHVAGRVGTGAGRPGPRVAGGGVHSGPGYGGSVRPCGIPGRTSWTHTTVVFPTNPNNPKHLMP